MESGFSEISEKKTSKLGYLLLVAMFLFMIIVGQTVFRDIAKIPESPDYITHCADMYISNPQVEGLEHLKHLYRIEHDCRYSDIDREFNLDVLIENLKPQLNIIIALNTDIQELTNRIAFNENQIDGLLQRYDLSLQEIIAGEADPLLDKPGIKAQILALWQENQNLGAEREALIFQRDDAITGLETKAKELRDALSEAREAFENRMDRYYLKIFILKIVFVMPFFAGSLYYYMRYKKQDSPYTIIVTAVFYASTILFLQVLLEFLYHILPMDWFSRIFNILMKVPLLRYIIYYGVTGVVILILGGIVYFIQKRIYDPQRVILRQLKENKCPNCSFDLVLSDEFCPNCGRGIKTKCLSCGKPMFADLAHCPHCGAKAEKS